MTRAPESVGRGFDRGEFEARLARAQAAMTADELDALVVTTAPNVRYFTGFNTQFWESPTRPWFIVVPREGAVIAVIPEIGQPGMAETWVEDIRTWPAPRPDDDGVSLLQATLLSLPRRFGRIGWEMGRESVVRMPLKDFDELRDRVGNLAFADGSPTLWSLRRVKSPAEVARLRHVCQIASTAFEALPQKLRIGDSEIEVRRKMQIELAEQGADSAPFVAVVSGKGGYSQCIVGPSERRLDDGDVLFIDTGATYDGYFCDFDRNFAFGHISDAAKRAHEAVWGATEAGIAAARPGATTTDLWRAMADVLEVAGSKGLNVGRMGHGLGMQLTEPPSNMPGDDTALAPGMVMTIEPGMEYAPGCMLLHEENVVITEDGAELLTRRAPREMPVITA
ncbi:MAG: Xaa-Pro peptidase family protein [Kiloniellales bacterium]